MTHRIQRSLVTAVVRLERAKLQLRAAKDAHWARGDEANADRLRAAVNELERARQARNERAGWHVKA